MPSDPLRGIIAPTEPQPLVIPEPEPAAEEAPAVAATPFKTPLKLTEGQRTKLESETLTRITELRREMGLTEINEVIPGSWMWLRKCHEAYYQGDLTWRLAMGGIFEKSNFTNGSGLKHVRYISGRVQDDLLGTTPFMAAMGRNKDKETLARQVEEYVQAEIGNAPVRSSLREGQKVALYRNECVVKVGWVKDQTPFVGPATVYVDLATGQPVKTPEKGLYVFEDDNLTPHPLVEGLMVLETDPSMTFAPDPEEGVMRIPADGEQPERRVKTQYFDELPQVLTNREGVYCEAIDYRSFLCPLRVKRIADADTVAHLELDTPIRMKRQFGSIDTTASYFAWWDQPGQDKPKYEQGETANPPTVIHQQIVKAEVYRRCDPDGTGEEKEIFMVFDLTNRKLVYYNFLANHMGARPFVSIPGIERVPGRWYGRGIYGMLEDHLLYEDAELNRANFKNSNAATIQFARKDACEEWKNGQPPMIGTGDTFWINPSFDPEGRGLKPIWRENLYDNAAPDVEMSNAMRQSADALVGAISSQSANLSDFNQSKTATGNQLVQQASDIITKATEQDQTEAIEEIMEKTVETVLEHMDRVKMRFSEHTDELVTLNRNECRSLSRDVRLLLTRSRSTQLLNSSQQALVVAKDYRAMVQTDPQGAKDLRELYVSQLKGLEVPDADKLCPEVTDEQIMAFQRAQMMQAGVPPQEPTPPQVVEAA